MSRQGVVTWARCRVKGWGCAAQSYPPPSFLWAGLELTSRMRPSWMRASALPLSAIFFESGVPALARSSQSQGPPPAGPLTSPPRPGAGGGVSPSLCDDATRNSRHRGGLRGTRESPAAVKGQRSPDGGGLTLGVQRAKVTAPGGASLWRPKGCPGAGPQGWGRGLG